MRIVRGALRPATVYECAYAATPRRRLARPPSLHAHRQESRFSFGFGFTALLLALANVCAPERLLIGLRGEAARIDGAGVPAAIAAPARAAVSGARQKRTKMAQDRGTCIAVFLSAAVVILGVLGSLVLGMKCQYTTHVFMICF